MPRLMNKLCVGHKLMKTYLVGGAVRDKLLGLPVKENDWVVVGATPQQMLDAGYSQVGKDFPVFLHPDSKEQYALARLERKTASGHKGFAFDTTGSVTLEDDLKRRDLTINAIAESADGTLIDPYGGQQDLAQRRLRHVSDAFAEDPLRVLRVARFAARLAQQEFSVAPETLALMRQMSESGELASLPGERVWQEILLALQTNHPDVFISVLRDCGALSVLLPELDKLFGIPQPEHHHPEVDTGIHILLCLQQAVKLSEDSVVRYAVLVHDLGKGLTNPAKWPSHVGHEMLGLQALDAVHKRIPVPNDYVALARLVSEHHLNSHRALELRSTTLLRLLESLDAFRRPQRLTQFCLACEADARGRTGLESRPYPQSAYLQSVYNAACEIDIPALLKENPESKPEDVIRRARLERIARVRDAQ